MYFQNISDVFLPSIFFKDVISLQLHDLSDSINGYIPQDHVIHSVNLYVLGVYLFFNNRLLNQKLLHDNALCAPINERVKSFVRKWKMFAFYHDVGYYYESNTSYDGSTKIDELLSTYNKTYEEILYRYTLRCMSRLIVLLSIIKRSNQKLCLSDFLKHYSSNLDKNISNFSSEGSKMLSEFDNATLINYVESIDSFNNFLPLLQKDKYLIIAFDQNENPIGFFKMTNNKILNKYVFNSYSTIDNEYLLYELEKNKGIKFKFYVPKLEEILEQALPACEKPLILKFYEELPEKYKLSFSYISTDKQIDKIYFDIINWLEEKTEKVILDSQIKDVYMFNLSDYYKKSIEKNILEKTNLYLKEQFVEPAQLNKCIKNILLELKPKVIENDIHEDAVKFYEEDNGVSYNIITFCKKLYLDIKNALLTYNDKNKTDFYKLEKLYFIFNDNNKIKINLFSHDKRYNDSSFEILLFNRIKHLAQRLKINFEELTQYVTKYSNCDHGLISSGLLYQTTVLYYYLLKYIKENRILGLAWSELKCNEKLEQEITVNEYAETIFSILIHNVYTKEAAGKYGIEYTHDIDVDPFSYFCACCDSLQRWDRPKQLNYAKVDIPKQYILGEDTDLFITEDIINIRCNLKNIGFWRREIDGAETFLPGISRIVNVSDLGK